MITRRNMRRYIGNNKTYMRKQMLLLSNKWQTYYIVQLLLYYSQWCYIQWNSVILSAEYSFLEIFILVHFDELLILRGTFTKIRYFSDLRVKKLWIQSWNCSRREHVYGDIACNRGGNSGRVKEHVPFYRE